MRPGCAAARARRWSNQGPLVCTGSLLQGSSSSSTRQQRFCSLRRKAFSFSRRGRRLLAGIATAGSAAFFAPAVPIASVATSTAGQHLSDREQGIRAPLAVSFSIGTPTTRECRMRSRHARKMRRPSRARDDHFNPTPFRTCAHLRHQLRCPMRRCFSAFVVRRNSVSISLATLIVSQSVLRP